MRLEPIASRTLRAADLGIAHLLGDFTTQSRRVLMTTHRGDVEPFVGLYQINGHSRACGIDHAEAETIFGTRWFNVPGGYLNACHLAPRYRSDRCPQGGGSLASLLPEPFVRVTRSSGENLNGSLSDAMNRK